MCLRSGVWLKSYRNKNFPAPLAEYLKPSNKESQPSKDIYENKSETDQKSEVSREIPEAYLDLRNKGLTDADMPNLLAHLEKNPFITHLNLAFNKIRDEGAKVLASNRTVTVLDLYSNLIGDEGAKALADNPILIDLNLSANINIGERGIKALAGSKSITTLTLVLIDIGEESAKSLESNTILTTLMLAFNKLDLPREEVLQKAIAKNGEIASKYADIYKQAQDKLLMDCFPKVLCHLIQQYVADDLFPLQAQDKNAAFDIIGQLNLFDGICKDDQEALLARMHDAKKVYQSTFLDRQPKKRKASVFSLLNPQDGVDCRVNTPQCPAFKKFK